MQARAHSQEGRTKQEQDTQVDERTAKQLGEQAVKSAEAEAAAQELDALLDSIDGLLEENAQEFVEAFVQKGGQ